MTHLVPSSTTLAFLTNMSEKCKSTLHSAMQVKSWWKAIGIEEQSDVISWLQEGEWIVAIYHNVRLAHSSLCMNLW
jgi:hypothetical protein